MKLRQNLALVTVIVMASLPVWAQHRSEIGAGGPIPPGTQVVVRFIDNLTSETAHQDDIFRATLEEPVVVNGRTLYPKDADVAGRVLNVHASGRLSDPGELELTLTSISFGGHTYPVTTDPYNIKGESHTKSNVGKIGGGTALGAIIGAIAGGGKGAAIGAGVGAGAGTATAAATGKKEARVESEAVLTFMTAGGLASESPATDMPRRQDDLDDARPYGRNPQPNDDVSRSYDEPRERPFRAEFTAYDRRQIRSCFNGSSSTSPTLARRDDLPPGLEKQLQRNSTLAPGLVKRIRQLPAGCDANLPPLPQDWGRVLVGRHVLMLDPDNRVQDMFALDGSD